MSDADSALVRRAQAGDQGAREQLFRTCVQSVYATALRYTGNAPDAEDITQETFVRALRAIGGFQGRSTFRTWLYRILLNTVADHFRKRAKDIPLPGVESVAGTTGDSAHPADGPAEVASTQEERELLRSALRQLPESQRSALVLVHLQGMSCREAAEVMNAKEGTVYYWLHEGRKRLARRLGRLLEPGGGPASHDPRKE